MSRVFIEQIKVFKILTANLICLFRKFINRNSSDKGILKLYFVIGKECAVVKWAKALHRG